MTTLSTPRSRLGEYRRRLNALRDELDEFASELEGGDPSETAEQHRDIERTIWRVRFVVENLDQAIEQSAWEYEIWWMGRAL